MDKASIIYIIVSGLIGGLLLGWLDSNRHIK